MTTTNTPATQPSAALGTANFKPSEQQFADWCKRHDLPPHHSRDAFDDAASLYLDAQQAAPGAQVATEIKTWRERLHEQLKGEKADSQQVAEFMYAEIADLRAALQQRQAPAPLALDDELAAIEETLAKGVQRQAPAQATGCDRPLIDVETALVLQRVAQFFDAVKDEVVPAARGDDFRNMTFKDVKRRVAALADPLNAERSKVANTLDRLEDLIAAPVAQQAEAAPASISTAAFFAALEEFKCSDMGLTACQQFADKVFEPVEQAEAAPAPTAEPRRK